MCLWPWAILYLLQPHWEQAPHTRAQVPVVSLCLIPPYPHPFRPHPTPALGLHSYDHSLGAWILRLLLWGPDATWGCSLGQWWPGGFSASGRTEQQRLVDTMETSSTLCYSETAPDQLSVVLESDGPPILPLFPPKTPGALPPWRNILSPWFCVEGIHQFLLVICPIPGTQ